MLFPKYKVLILIHLPILRFYLSLLQILASLFDSLLINNSSLFKTNRKNMNLLRWPTKKNITVTSTTNRGISDRNNDKNHGRVIYCLLFSINYSCNVYDLTA